MLRAFIVTANGKLGRHQCCGWRRELLQPVSRGATIVVDRVATSVAHYYDRDVVVLQAVATMFGPVATNTRRCWERHGGMLRPTRGDATMGERRML